MCIFIKKVKAMSKPTELTAELVNDFIEKIVVSKPVYIEGKRHQTIDIYYNGVGMIEELTPDEFAKKFIQGKIKKPKMWQEEKDIKEKTA